tara:strand:- start:194 stop:418 length:225 start_codon:yes stop_codon:yes gene_type:complete
MDKDTKKKYDSEVANKVKEKIISMYKNYGIDTDDMLDEEFGRVLEYYLINTGDLDSDYKESIKAAKDSHFDQLT